MRPVLKVGHDPADSPARPQSLRCSVGAYRRLQSQAAGAADPRPGWHRPVPRTNPPPGLHAQRSLELADRLCYLLQPEGLRELPHVARKVAGDLSIHRADRATTLEGSILLLRSACLATCGTRKNPVPHTRPGLASLPSDFGRYEFTPAASVLIPRLQNELILMQRWPRYVARQSASLAQARRILAHA